MAKFFVGQRVRVVGDGWTGRGENPVGKEGRIIAKGLLAPSGIFYEWELEMRGYQWLACQSEELEPIIPDGHRAGVKGECSLLDDLLSREVKSDTLVPLPQQSES